MVFMGFERIYSLYDPVYSSEVTFDYVTFRKVLNTRGELTVEAIVTRDGKKYVSSAPAGKSKGENEVIDFPENWEKSARNLLPSLKNKTFKEIEEILIKNKNKIGGSLSISISLACLNALFDRDVAQGLLGNKSLINIKPVGKIFGGGKHCNDYPEFQEFLLVPNAKSFKDGAFLNAEIYNNITEVLKECYISFNYGRDYESGWIINDSNEKLLEILYNNIPYEINIGLDVAATSFYRDGYYYYKNYGKVTKEDHIDYILNLVEDFHILYLEDPLYEEDFEGFVEITKKLKNKCLIIGDDLFTTNVERLKTGIELGACNSILIKPNQIGTFTETLLTIETARKNNYIPVLSHRSAITDDPILAHLCVGLQIPYFKCGIAGERIININEIIRLEEEMKDDRG